MNRAPEISVVVPVYRGERFIEELYRRLTAALEPITAEFEIVLVEDCGGDRSWELIEGLARRDRRVRGLQFSRNFGQHYAITAGLDHCTGAWTVVMDCDLQDRPEDISLLYAKAREGYDVVIARRGLRHHPPLKRLSSWLFYRVFSYLSDIDYDGRTGNFRIMSRRVVQNVRRIREQMRFLGGMVSWMGFPTAKVDVQQGQRPESGSSYSFRRLWRLAGDVIIAYSDKPLRLAVRLGFVMSGLAFLYGLFIIYLALFRGIPVSGYASLIASLYFIGGVIIAILGILGIYLGKTFDEAKGRPLYVVMRATDETGASES
jgi:dolichol-phosphate mannosyltransferase